MFCSRLAGFFAVCRAARDVGSVRNDGREIDDRSFGGCDAEEEAFDVDFICFPPVLELRLFS